MVHFQTMNTFSYKVIAVTSRSNQDILRSSCLSVHLLFVTLSSRCEDFGDFSSRSEQLLKLHSEIREGYENRSKYYDAQWLKDNWNLRENLSDVHDVTNSNYASAITDAKNNLIARVGCKTDAVFGVVLFHSLCELDKGKGIHIFSYSHGEEMAMIHDFCVDTESNHIYCENQHAPCAEVDDFLAGFISTFNQSNSVPFDRVQLMVLSTSN